MILPDSFDTLIKSAYLSQDVETNSSNGFIHPTFPLGMDANTLFDWYTNVKKFFISGVSGEGGGALAITHRKKPLVDVFTNTKGPTLISSSVGYQRAVTGLHTTASGQIGSNTVFSLDFQNIRRYPFCVNGVPLRNTHTGNFSQWLYFPYLAFPTIGNTSLSFRPVYPGFLDPYGVFGLTAGQGGGSSSATLFVIERYSDLVFTVSGSNMTIKGFTVVPATGGNVSNPIDLSDVSQVFIGRSSPVIVTPSMLHTYTETPFVVTVVKYLVVPIPNDATEGPVSFIGNSSNVQDSDFYYTRKNYSP